MGGHGHRVEFESAHYQAIRFNALARLGTVGIVFQLVVCWRRQHFVFLYRRMPIAPAVTRSIPVSLLRILTILRIELNSFRVCVACMGRCRGSVVYAIDSGAWNQ